MKIHIHGPNNITLQGSPRDFAKLVNNPDAPLSDVRQDVLQIFGALDKFDLEPRGQWSISGTWRQFAQTLGIPEAVDFNNVTVKLKSAYPDVDMTLATPPRFGQYYGRARLTPRYDKRG